MILCFAIEITDITKSSSSVAMMYFPSGVKKESSGMLKVWPGARSPGRGNSQTIDPCGLTTINRLLDRSAIKIGPGSTEGFDPGARTAGVSAFVISLGRVTLAFEAFTPLDVDTFLLFEAELPAAVVEGLFVATFDDEEVFLLTTFIAPKVAPAIKIIIAMNRKGLDICSYFPKP